MTKVNEFMCDWCKKTTEDSVLPKSWITFYVGEAPTRHFCDGDCLAAYAFTHFGPKTRHGAPVYYPNRGT